MIKKQIYNLLKRKTNTSRQFFSNIQKMQSQDNNNQQVSNQSTANPFFNTQEFKQQGNDMINMITDLYDNLDKVPVQPKVEPGFLRAQFDFEPPKKGEDMNNILKETREKIFPGITQWQHPGFFGYYPSGTSHPAVLADMFSSTFNSPGFVFNVSPSHTEVENIVVDWLVQLFDLPEHFLLKNSGGGALQISISDAIFNSVHAAKRRKMEKLKISNTNPDMLKFVGYYTEHSFQACEKSLMLKDIGHVRVIPIYFDEKLQNYQPDIEKFKEMLQQDLDNGLIPFWLNITQGTTPTCANDPIEKFYEIVKDLDVWINVDAAYSGVSWVCPEFRQNIKGLELVDSLMINCAKFMLIGMNGAVIFVKNKVQYQQQFSMQPMEIYKNSLSQRQDCIDYSNWFVGFGRRFNSLKMFYVIKYFGQEGLQQHIREKVELSRHFQKLINDSSNFEIFVKPDVTLVCFRYVVDKQKKNNYNTEQLNALNKQLKEILDQDTNQGLITCSQLNNTYFLRLVVNNVNTKQQHINQFWDYMQKQVQNLK